MEKGEQKYLMEVKGCTLEVDGIGYFPDAPTERGVKHLHELAQAQRKGYQCAVAFVIQMGHHRGAAKCQHTAGVWHGTGRSKGRRCAGAVFALPCGA